MAKRVLPAVEAIPSGPPSSTLESRRSQTDRLFSTTTPGITLSTLVGYVSDGSLLGDINGDNKVDCTDMSTVRASFGARKGQAKYNPLADVNNDNVVDVKDLLVVSKQLPPKTVCK